MPITTYQQSLDWLYSFVRYDSSRRHHPGGDLTRMQALLARLGNPEERFPSVLIAGTKGKGSTASMLASILRSAGYRTGLYTSPHLHTFRERVRVDDRLITQEEVVAGANRLLNLAPDFPDVIWFELVTALALGWLAEQHVDIAVLEVGLGGRLDPTNVVNPLVSVITSISYDHMEVLGSTLAAIASEKAGIIKHGIPVVLAPQHQEAGSVIVARAAERHAPLIRVGSDWSWEALSISLEGQRFKVRKGEPDSETAEYFSPLIGQHQMANATTALAAADVLRKRGWQISPSALEQGLARVHWPARFEVLTRGPLIVADGAHNRSSAHELASTLDALCPRCPLQLIYGASNDKDIQGMFEELLPRVSALVLTHSQHVRAADPAALSALAAQFHVPIQRTSTVAEALEFARRQALTEQVICVTGSLFVAAEARELILRERGIQVERD